MWTALRVCGLSVTFSLLVVALFVFKTSADFKALATLLAFALGVGFVTFTLIQRKINIVLKTNRRFIVGSTAVVLVSVVYLTLTMQAISLSLLLGMNGDFSKAETLLHCAKLMTSKTLFGPVTVSSACVTISANSKGALESVKTLYGVTSPEYEHLMKERSRI